MHRCFEFPVNDHQRPVLITKFEEHVKEKHLNRDRLFDLEYTVSIYITILTIMLYNMSKTRLNSYKWGSAFSNTNHSCYPVTLCFGNIKLIH